MNTHLYPHHFSSAVPGKFGFLKGSFARIAIWPLAALLSGVLLWVGVDMHLAEQRAAIERNAQSDARFLSGTYAQYLEQEIEQIDRLSLLVQYEWERSRQPLELKALAEQHAFHVAPYAVITIFNADGAPVDSNRRSDRLARVRNQACFLFHRDNSSRELYIGQPVVDPVSNKPVVQFTRRLEKANGSFDGIVLISVEPRFFTYLYESASLGQQGLLATVGTDQVVRGARIGGTGGQTGNPLREVPVPASMDGSLLDGVWFNDGESRYLAAQRLRRYPLLAVVGIASAERLAPYWHSAENLRGMALLSTFVLGLFAFVATLLSVRLAQRRHAEAEVQEAYRLATEGGSEGFYMLRALRDHEGGIIDFEVVDCNEHGAALYGMIREEFIGARSSVLNGASYFPLLMQTYCKAIEDGFYEDDFRVPLESPIRAEWIHRRLVRSGTGLAATVRDISDIKAHERELARLANEDALTALPNRHWFKHYLPDALEQARQRGAMVALLFVDLDNFKNVNDTLGHSAGDELLHAAALRLKATVRPTDHVVRLGGDEFTIILRPLGEAGDAAAVAGRIIEAFRHPFELARGKQQIGASIGISLFPQDGTDAETLLKNSDIAMYQAKAKGKGHYRFYEESQSELLKNRLDNERALQLALEEDQFELHYQPRIDTRTGELRSLEALVRWRHPERGLVSPVEFIPLAEETGLILRLGALVLDGACAQIAQWRRERLPLVPVSINVSPQQFNRGQIANAFSKCLVRHGIESRLVEMEITESSMISEHAEVASELAALRKLGIKLLVDDFGTGYSSLSQLQQLDMDVLKIDRAFTSNLCKSAEGEVFIRAIVSMAHALGMAVVAEGVETLEQLHALQRLACDEVQGFLVARPLPAGEIPALLQRRYLLPLQERKSA
jgi:diguanylate cyclase (GGDEF)-like protein